MPQRNTEWLHQKGT